MAEPSTTHLCLPPGNSEHWGSKSLEFQSWFSLVKAEEVAGAGVITVVGSAGPSFWGDDLLSLLGPETGEDTCAGVGGRGRCWGSAPAHSPGMLGVPLPSPCIPYSSWPPACAPGCCTALGSWVLIGEQVCVCVRAP